MLRLLAIVAIAPVAATVFFSLLWRYFTYWRAHAVAAYAMIVATLGAAIVAAIVWRDDLLAVQLDLPAWLAAIGWIVVALANVLGFVADRQLGWHVRFFMPFFERGARIELVTTGAYAIVRHPIYSAFVFLQLGTFLATGYVAVAVACVVFASGAAWFTRQEERRLVELLADPAAYDRYRARVRALIPFVY